MGWRVRAGIAGLGGILLVGCAAPDKQAVYVNVGGLLVAEAPKVANSPQAPKPPAPAPAVVESAPGRPAETVKDPARASEGALSASIERQQREAQAALERRLRDYYATQAEQFQLEKEAGLDKEKSAAYDAESAKIRAVFLKYADARAPKTLRLTLLVGFPDPNPNSEPPRVTLKTFMKKRMEEAKTIREEMAQLDASFKAQVESMIGAVTANLRAKEEEIRLQVEAFRKELNDRAAREAAAEVNVSIRALGLKLIDVPPVRVPASAPTYVEIPAEAPLPPAPQVPSVGIPNGIADRRKLLEHELAIWLGMNRYRLEDGATDRTEDFKKWRQKYRAGL